MLTQNSSRTLFNPSEGNRSKEEQDGRIDGNAESFPKGNRVQNPQNHGTLRKTQ